MRNRLVHAYFDVNLVRVWDTVQQDIPRLVSLLDPLVPPENAIAEEGVRTGDRPRGRRGLVDGTEELDFSSGGRGRAEARVSAGLGAFQRPVATLIRMD